VALVSGGLDSLALTVHLLRTGHRVSPLYIRCGLAWESAELAALRRWLARLARPGLSRLATLDMPIRSVYGPHWSLGVGRAPSFNSADETVYLPGRNLLLLSHAAVYADRLGISMLALGLLAGNPFGDATPRFLRAWAACAGRALGRALRVLAPLRRLRKAALIRRAPSLPFALTVSCLRPRGLRHCGRCNKCAERRRAFTAAGRPDPTDYGHG
jgi:7-cyano-7-deazaguanine synthase